MNGNDRHALVLRVSTMSLSQINEEIALDTVAAQAAAERRDALAQLAIVMGEGQMLRATEMSPRALAVCLGFNAEDADAMETRRVQ